jgi:hypothetical protein
MALLIHSTATRRQGQSCLVLCRHRPSSTRIQGALPPPAVEHGRRGGACTPSSTGSSGGFLATRRRARHSGDFSGRAPSSDPVGQYWTAAHGRARLSDGFSGAWASSTAHRRLFRRSAVEHGTIGRLDGHEPSSTAPGRLFWPCAVEPRPVCRSAAACRRVTPARVVAGGTRSSTSRIGISVRPGPVGQRELEDAMSP